MGKKKWDQNDVVAVSVFILQFSSWISNIKLDIELPARLLFLDDLKDFEIFPRVDVGSFKPLHINLPQNNIAMIIRTQIPIKPAIKLFWFFKSASVKSEIKDTFLFDFYELRLHNGFYLQKDGWKHTNRGLYDFYPIFTAVYILDQFIMQSG